MAAVAAIAALCHPSTAGAARVIVLEGSGQATVRIDRALAGSPPEAPLGGQAMPRAARLRVAHERTVGGELTRLYRSHAIDSSDYHAYSASFASALTEVKRLSPSRALELQAVISNLHNIAAAGMLTPSRLSALFLTVDRNRQWWNTGPLLSYGQRVEFAGSELVWEYYPGQGLELQELGTFGKADWFCTAGAKYAAQCRETLSEVVPLAAQRAGGLVWEYYFNFDGGVPPWTSAMSQGTALQALADAYRSLGDASYLETAGRALSVFSAAPPAGVGVRTRVGLRYLQYSFAPARNEEVINGFLQSLIGLDDYARTSRNRLAARLFVEGNAEAVAELPRFDTGAWSLYQPGVEDDLSYHQLVTGFLRELCTLTRISVYCHTAARFERYLKAPPALQLLTVRLDGHQPAAVYFELSKISRVGITLQRDAKTLFMTSADFPYGRHRFAIPKLAAGTYLVLLDATDLAGNYKQIGGTLRVARQLTREDRQTPWSPGHGDPAPRKRAGQRAR